MAEREGFEPSFPCGFSLQRTRSPGMRARQNYSYHSYLLDKIYAVFICWIIPIQLLFSYNRYKVII